MLSLIWLTMLAVLIFVFLHLGQMDIVIILSLAFITTLIASIVKLALKFTKRLTIPAVLHLLVEMFLFAPVSHLILHIFSEQFERLIEYIRESTPHLSTYFEVAEFLSPLIISQLITVTLLLIAYCISGWFIMVHSDAWIERVIPDKDERASFCEKLETQLNTLIKEGTSSKQVKNLPRLFDSTYELNEYGKKSFATNLIKALKKSKELGIAMHLIQYEVGSGKSISIKMMCLDLLKNMKMHKKMPLYIDLKNWHIGGDVTNPATKAAEKIKDFLRDGIVGLEKFMNDYFAISVDKRAVYFVLDSYDTLSITGNERDAIYRYVETMKADCILTVGKKTIYEDFIWQALKDRYKGKLDDVGILNMNNTIAMLAEIISNKHPRFVMQKSELQTKMQKKRIAWKVDDVLDIVVQARIGNYNSQENSVEFSCEKVLSKFKMRPVLSRDAFSLKDAFGRMLQKIFSFKNLAILIIVGLVLALFLFSSSQPDDTSYPGSTLIEIMPTASPSPPTPTPRPLYIERARISVGGGHSAMIDADGALYTWGLNRTGQIGDGTYINSLSPALMKNEAVSLAAGGGHTLAVATNGALWASAANGFWKHRILGI